MNTTMPLNEYDFEKRAEKRQKDAKHFVLWIVIAFVVVPIAWNIWTNNVSLNVTEIVGSADLCPGDQLVFKYHLHTRGDGVFIRDLTTWKISPPKTVIFSEPRRFIINGQIDQDLYEAWEVPEVYFNYENWREEPLPPGLYLRQLAVTSSTNSIAEDMVSVPFTIREDCYGEVPVVN